MSETSSQQKSTGTKVCVIKDIVNTFNNVKQDDAQKFDLVVADKAPDSGGSLGTIDPRHHQGMYCLGGSDFAITGSAITSAGYLYIFRNRAAVIIEDLDKTYKLLDDVNTHPSGIQVANDILAVGNEKYGSGFSTRKDTGYIRFYKLNYSDSEICTVDELTHLSFSIEDRASAIGLTNLGEQWILAVRANAKMKFYQFTGDITHPKSTFEKLTTEIPIFSNNDDDDRSELKEFQSIALFWGTDGQSLTPELYLFGMPYKTTIHDKCRLYKLITIKKPGTNIIENITNVETKVSKHFKRSGTGPRFKYASCVYFEPDEHNDLTLENAVSGQFKVYSASAHVENRRIRCNEWTKAPE